MSRIVLATRNQHKLKELEAIFDFPDLEILTLNDFENITEVVEDGHTFEENATKKALGYAQQTQCLTLADDSGICVDYLNGAPGIYSSRYAGEGKDGLANCEKLLEEMKDCPPEQRTAHFNATIALAEPDRLIDVVSGECHGTITTELRGEKGFGYDPLFYYPGYQATFGETDEAKKNKVSHRYHALKKTYDVLEAYLKR